MLKVTTITTSTIKVWCIYRNLHTLDNVYGQMKHNKQELVRRSSINKQNLISECFNRNKVVLITSTIKVWDFYRNLHTLNNVYGRIKHNKQELVGKSSINKQNFISKCFNRNRVVIIMWNKVLITFLRIVLLVIYENHQVFSHKDSSKESQSIVMFIKSRILTNF